MQKDYHVLQNAVEDALVDVVIVMLVAFADKIKLFVVFIVEKVTECNINTKYLYLSLTTLQVRQAIQL